MRTRFFPVAYSKARRLRTSPVKKKLLITLLAVALLAGGGVYAYRQARLRSVPEVARRCLRQPQQMTLYSIHPEEPESVIVGAQLFHGYRILG